MGRVNDGLHSAATKTIYRQRRSFDRQSSAQSYVPRAVQSVAGSLLRIAKDDVLEFFWIDSSAIHCTFSRNSAQFLRSEIFQLAAITSEWRACAADDCNVTWFQHGYRKQISLRGLRRVRPVEHVRKKLLIAGVRSGFAEIAEKT